MSSSFVTSLLADSVLAESSTSSGGSILSFLFLPLILVGMYFLMIRPQRRRQREQQELQRALAVGDEVVTTSGIFGTITGEDGDNRFWLEIDNDVQIRIARVAIQQVVNQDDDSDDSDDAADITPFSGD